MTAREPFPAEPWPKVTVRSLQYLLNARGAKLTVDGVFGPKTQLWIRAFQAAEGFKSDGVAGLLTWQALVTESLSG